MTRTAGRVVCVGDLLVDLLVEVDGLPRRGGAVWSEPPRRFAGGTAGNVAAALARLDVAVAVTAVVGDDPDGHELLADLTGHGVGVDGVRRTGERRTGVAIGMVEPGGERTFVAAARAAAHSALSAADLAVLTDPAVDPPAAVFLTGLVLLEEPARGAVVELAAALAGRTRVYFDPNLRTSGAPDPSVADAVVAVADRSDVLLAGDDEAHAVGLAPRRGQLFVEKRGGRGAALRHPDGTADEQAALPGAAVDTTGAGDVFDAAFLAAQLHGHPPERALRLATVAAGLSVRSRGARAGPTWDEIHRTGTGAG